MDSVDYKELSNSRSQFVNVPLVIRQAILMSQGIWNEMYYDKSEIKKAFDQTDWNSREKRNLFLDHKDKEASEWIGDVQNLNFKEDTLYGDLFVYDPIWAAKLKYGNPKVGISPKVMGDADEKNKIMSNFTFENFSVVMNPAVKRAYINNMENLKIDENESANEGEDAEKKIVNVNETLSKTESTKKQMEEKNMENDVKDLAVLFELFESKNLSVTDVIRKSEEIRKDEESLKDAIQRAGRILEEEAVKATAEVAKEEAKVVEEAKVAAEEKKKKDEVAEVKDDVVKDDGEEAASEEGIKEMKQKIKELSQKIETLSNEPETRELTKTSKELISEDPDVCMMKYLRKMEVDSTNVA